MIIDSHCHAWATWPYKPPVPDPESRGRVEQLLHEMDVNGVDQAVIVCAQIDHNPVIGGEIRFPVGLQLVTLYLELVPPLAGRHTPLAANASGCVHQFAVT